MKDLICKCNHKFSEHIFVLNAHILCEECYRNSDTLVCEEFIPDNLKFLENQYRQKVKSND